MAGMGWNVFVDLVTVVWLFFFILGFVEPSLEELCGNINLGLLPIFVLDLVVRYRRVGNLKLFLRHHWFDIIIVIPYFRFLRVLRILRAARVARTVKAAKAVKTMKLEVKYLASIEKWVKAVKKAKRILKRLKFTKKT